MPPTTTLDAWTRLIDPDDVPWISEQFEGALRGEREYDVEYRLLREDGTENWLNSCGRVFFNVEGKAVHMLGIVYDITELRLSWREFDGPKVAPPSRKGFGSRLIQRSLEGELNGRAALDFPPTGAHCEIVIPFQAGTPLPDEEPKLAVAV